MNRKERRRQAKLGQAATGAARSAVATTASPGGFGANDALALLAGLRPSGSPPPAMSSTPPAAPQPPPPPPPEEAVFTAVYARTLAVLRGRRTPEALAAAVRDATERAEQLWGSQRPAIESRRSPGLACAAGCAWCCYQQVAVEPAEAIAIAHHIEQLAPAARAAIEGRLAAVDGRTRGLGIQARARLKEPCAFLVDGRCSIYEVRPLRCRGVYSRDANHCRWAMENPDLYFGGQGQKKGSGPYPIEPTRIVDAALVGLHRATRESGLARNPLELVAAVRTLLTTPESSRRYLAGEPVLAEAILPPQDAGLVPSPPPAGQPGLAETRDSP